MHAIYRSAILLLAIFTLSLTTFTQAETMQAVETSQQNPCIAVALPQARLNQDDVTRDISILLQAELITALNDSGLNAISLPTRQSEQLVLQAQQAGCDQLLTTEVIHKKKSRWSKLFGIGLSVGSHHSGVGIGVGMSTEIGRSKTTATGQGAGTTLTTAQSLLRKGDTIRLDYELQKVGIKKALSSVNFKAKANYDGEDLLQPLVKKAATEIAAALKLPLK